MACRWRVSAPGSDRPRALVEESLEVPLRSPPIAPDPAFSAAAAPIDAVHRRQMASGSDISSSQRICTLFVMAFFPSAPCSASLACDGNPAIGKT